jgi:tetratricopeptide (TPR) repeat protein
MAKTTLRRKTKKSGQSAPTTTAPAGLGATHEQQEAFKLFKKGAQLQKRGDYRAAAKMHLKGLKLDKDSVYGRKLLADTLANLGRRNLAIQTYEHALELAPDDMEIHFGLGNIALTMQMYDVAARFFEIYTIHRPDDPAGFNNFASALRMQEKLDDAIALLQRVLPLHPESSQLWNTLAATVYERDGLDASIPFYEEALRLDPNSGMTLNNLGRCMEQKGDFERGVELAHRALRVDKRLTEPRMVLSACLLTLGELAEGWENYSERFNPRRPDTIFYTHGLPEWRGEDISEKTLLICPEQGLGDEILFANVFGDVIKKAKQCLIGCDRRLVPLFARSFPEAKVGAYVDSRHDAHRFRTLPFAEADDVTHGDIAIPAGELMKFFRPTTESFPERAGFLTPDPERVTYWKSRLDDLGPGPKVGICWRSGMRNVDRNRYYTSLDDWGPIFGVPGVQFVNLQYDDCKAEIDAARARHGVDIHMLDGIDLKDDLDDAAALTAALDLVLSAPTSVGMTAIGVGTELWSLLRMLPFWSFGQKDHSPIHANSRLFIWPENGSWPEVIEAVGAELRKFAAN